MTNSSLGEAQAPYSSCTMEQGTKVSLSPWMNRMGIRAFITSFLALHSSRPYPASLLAMRSAICITGKAGIWYILLSTWLNTSQAEVKAQSDTAAFTCSGSSRPVDISTVAAPMEIP